MNLSSWGKELAGTEIFSEAQGEKEVCKDLCSSCSTSQGQMGWASLAQLRTEDVKRLARAYLLFLLLQGCSMKSEPQSKASPRASQPHRSASE